MASPDMHNTPVSDPNVSNSNLASEHEEAPSNGASTLDITELNAILDRIRQLAHTCDRDCSKLLVILRGIEAVHREVCEDCFQPALPDNRQALYALLKDIESEGGWPYINRMKLQDFLNRLEAAAEDNLVEETAPWSDSSPSSPA
jgi:hypothetical protein